MSCPTNKLSFDTEAHVLEHIKKRKGYKMAGYYLCPLCGLWHLTTKPQRQVEHNKKLVEKIKALKFEVGELKMKLNTVHQAHDKEIRKDKAIKEKDKQIERLRNDNSELIMKLHGTNSNK